MCLSVSDHQLKTYIVVIYESHGNQKPKIYNRYTHKKEKGIQT